MPGLNEVHIDAALTNFALQTVRDQNYAADKVFPIVPVRNESDKYFKFLKEDLSQDTESLRADGAPAQEIVWSLTTDYYRCKEYALKSLITDRMAQNADAPIRPRQVTVRKLLHKVQLGIEKRIADIVNDTTIITNNGTVTVKWDGTNPTIEKDIDAAREAVAAACGEEPNTIVIPPKVARVVKRDSQIRELIKYTHEELLADGDLPSLLWGMRVVIPGALRNTAAPGLAQSLARVWNLDSVLIAYVSPFEGVESLSLGYQFRCSQQGSQILVSSWREDDRKGEFVEVSVINDEKAVAPDCAYLITDVLT